MEYLVSIENTNYHWWQIELLIESFKMHGLEDKLVVAVADCDMPKYQDFTRNLRAHERKFPHPNYGRARNYLPLNRSYAAFLAQENKLIEQPFCVIDPDMVLHKPMAEPLEDITFQLRWMFSEEEAARNGVIVGDLIKETLTSRKLPDQKLWLPIGSVMTFKDVPTEFFQRAVMWAERLEFDRQKALRKKDEPVDSWWETARVGWVMAMIDYYGYKSFRGDNTYEMRLIDMGLDHNFIHYQHGLPPVWHKNMYKYEPPAALCMGGSSPFDLLLENNPTTTTNYLQNVIKSYLKGGEG